jgi:hypothetical protein
VRWAPGAEPSATSRAKRGDPHSGVRELVADRVPHRGTSYRPRALRLRPRNSMTNESVYETPRTRRCDCIFGRFISGVTAVENKQEQTRIAERLGGPWSDRPSMATT